MGNSSWRTILVRLGAARIAYGIAKTDYHVVSTVVSDHYEPMQLNLWLLRLSCLFDKSIFRPSYPVHMFYFVFKVCVWLKALQRGFLQLGTLICAGEAASIIPGANRVSTVVRHLSVLGLSALGEALWRY